MTNKAEIIESFERLLAVLRANDRPRQITAFTAMREALREEFSETVANEYLQRLLEELHRRDAHDEREARREEHFQCEEACKQSLPLPPEPPSPPAVPPGLAETRIGCLILSDRDFVNAYQVLDEAAAAYRYRFRIRAAVEKDLLRWSTVYSRTVFFECHSGRPVPKFERMLVMSWLAAGGRAWIIAELERRSNARVVAFRRRAQ